MTTKDFALPDLGEGLTESEIVAWRVGVGDAVELNQIIAEVETAKALVEVPSPFAGTVTTLYAETGSTVRVGAPIVAFEIADDSNLDDSDLDDSDHEDETPACDPLPDETHGSDQERQSMLVGRGPAPESTERPHRRSRSGGSAGGETTDAADVAHAGPHGVAADPDAAERPRSTPPVRALARELGVELAGVTGTGEDGLITREDVMAHADRGGGAEDTMAPPTEDASNVVVPGGRAVRREREVRTAIAGVRKRTADAMVRSAFTAPQVTEFLTVDVTASSELIASLQASPEFRGHRITVLSVVAKALCLALDRTPDANAHWDEDAGEIVTYGYVNLGIAVATPRGLLVPAIKDADTLTLAQLSDAIAELAERARAAKTTPAELGGGTISITNVGVFGVDAGTPILNPGEAAIVAMGAVQRRPWEFDGEVALRDVMTLSLTFDHRLVDGEQGSRLLRDIGAIVKNPAVSLAMV